MKAVTSQLNRMHAMLYPATHQLRAVLGLPLTGYYSFDYFTDLHGPQRHPHAGVPRSRGMTGFDFKKPPDKPELQPSKG